MDIYFNGTAYRYELENVARMFCAIDELREGRPQRGEDYIYVRAAKVSGGERFLCAVACGDGFFQSRELGSGDKDARELCVCRTLFLLLSRIYGVKPPFGVMTGVRPAKFTAALLRAGGDGEQVSRRLRDVYLLDGDKVQLCVRCAEFSEKVRASLTPRSFSLFIDIPFCPSRCSYCSFVSRSTERDSPLLREYVEHLCRELVCVGRIAAQCALRLDTVYVGGGTPSILSAAQINKLLTCVRDNFNLSTAREFTFEAGRPDTIDAEKLQVLRECGVSRLSINPQTFNDEVLRGVGRRHSTTQTLAAFELARLAGFNDINADLIAGLPGDTTDSFFSSVSQLISLAPANITVHALTLKRASDLAGAPRHCEGAAQMVSGAAAMLAKAGYRPYYMYRQKATLDNLENVGYAKPGTEGIYNVLIMDEMQTIAACGAAAVSKLVRFNGKTPTIKRIYNYKYPAEYLRGFDEILARKKGIRDFYEGSI